MKSAKFNRKTKIYQKNFGFFHVLAKKGVKTKIKREANITMTPPNL